MNLVWPRLNLAPDADPLDGKLDLVFVGERNRDHLLAGLRAVLSRPFRALRRGWSDSRG